MTFGKHDYHKNIEYVNNLLLRHYEYNTSIAWLLIL